MSTPIIFHSPLEPQASPVIWGSWKVSPAELIDRSGAAGGFGNDVHQVCGLFVAWCLSQEPPIVWHIFLDSLPGIPWSGWSGDCDKRAWYERLMAELGGWKPPPVLVDVDNHRVTQDGAVLWPAERRDNSQHRLQTTDEAS